MPPIVSQVQDQQQTPTSTSVRQHQQLQRAINSAISRSQFDHSAADLLDPAMKLDLIIAKRNSSTNLHTSSISPSTSSTSNLQQMFISTATTSTGTPSPSCSSSRSSTSSTCDSSSPVDQFSFHSSSTLLPEGLVDSPLTPGGLPANVVLANLHRRLDRSHSEPVWQQQPLDNRQQTTNSSRYKTELCRPFEESGFCKYGEKCQFAHGGMELRTLTRHPKYKTELCRTFHTTGICPYGPRCHFIHNAEESRVVSPIMSAITQAAPPPALISANHHHQQQQHAPLAVTQSLGIPASVFDKQNSPPNSLHGSPTTPGGSYFFDEGSSFSHFQKDILLENLAETFASLRLNNKLNSLNNTNNIIQNNLGGLQLNGNMNYSSIASSLLAKTQQIEELLKEGGLLHLQQQQQASFDTPPGSPSDGSMPPLSVTPGLDDSSLGMNGSSSLRLPVFQNINPV